MRYFALTILGCYFLPLLAYSKAITIQLYDRPLCIEIGSNINLTKKFPTSNKGLQDFHFTLKKENYSAVESILRIRQELNLDDWFILKIIDEIDQKIKINNITFFKWFILGEMGYKVKMMLMKKKAFLFVESYPSMINIIKNGNYYCLNCDSTLQGQSFNFMYPTPYDENKNRFNFQITNIKAFDDEEYINEYCLKRYNVNDSIKIDILFSRDVLRVFDDLPNYSMLLTFSTPLSRQSEKLVDILRSLVSDLPDSSKVNYIMRFISSNSIYASDEENFRENDRWMTPEQFLFYGKGDCEDKSALLFYVLKQILNKPILIISYPKLEHVNVAISLDINGEPDVVYKNRRYFICEATVNEGFIPVGKYKINKSSKFNIVGEYSPEITVH